MWLSIFLDKLENLRESVTDKRVIRLIDGIFISVSVC